MWLMITLPRKRRHLTTWPLNWFTNATLPQMLKQKEPHPYTTAWDNGWSLRGRKMVASGRRPPCDHFSHKNGIAPALKTSLRPKWFYGYVGDHGFKVQSGHSDNDFEKWYLSPLNLAPGITKTGMKDLHGFLSFNDLLYLLINVKVA